MRTCYVRQAAKAAALAMMMAFGATGASAQAVAAFVNGEPITTYDVDQRMKINSATGKRGMSRQQVLNELIDDRVKVIEARRIGYRLTEDNIDDQVERIARQNNQSSVEFMQNLARIGVDANAYKAKMRADYSWELALSHKFKASGVTASDVDTIFESKLKEGGAKVTDYVLQSVIFVVSRTGEGAGARTAAANAARARFNDCETGIEMLRQLRDVAIKAQVKRSSNQLSPQLVALFAKTPVGKLTPPFRSDQGVEMVAVCDKTDRIDQTALRTRAEEEATAKKRAGEAEAYLKSLRSKAVVQYR